MKIVISFSLLKSMYYDIPFQFKRKSNHLTSHFLYIYIKQTRNEANTFYVYVYLYVHNIRKCPLFVQQVRKVISQIVSSAF